MKIINFPSNLQNFGEIENKVQVVRNFCEENTWVLQ